MKIIHYNIVEDIWRLQASEIIILKIFPWWNRSNFLKNTYIKYWIKIKNKSDVIQNKSSIRKLKNLKIETLIRNVEHHFENILVL